MRRRFLLQLLALTGSLGALFATDIKAESRPVATIPVVVISKELGIKDISLGALRRAFLGAPTTLADRKLVPFNYVATDPLRQLFDHRVLGMTPDEVGRYWVERRIRGEGMPPKTVPSQELLRAVVAKLPGAIGYVSSDRIDGSVQPLSIDGKSYTDPGYPLR